jgi:glutathione S-transferase
MAAVARNDGSTRLYSYHASGNCLKVRCLLGLLGVDFELIEVDLFGGGTLTEEFGRLNPLREVPVLVTAAGEVITQSNAILTFLADGTEWGGSTALERARIAAWLAFEQEWIMTAIGGARFRILTGRATPERMTSRIASGARGLDVMEDALADQPWLLGGRPTIADVSIWAYAHLAGDAGIELKRWPQVSAWAARLAGLDGFVDDLAPYPANARAGAGSSTYD